ncbi:MAG: Spo0E family sporulation regulatory protein-aspartic acid phosphatase [Thermotaleaceae bacterium]
MDTSQFLLEEITVLKDFLNTLIQEKEFNLLDPDILHLSRKIDSLLTQYRNTGKGKPPPIG